MPNRYVYCAADGNMVVATEVGVRIVLIMSFAGHLIDYASHVPV